MRITKIFTAAILLASTSIIAGCSKSAEKENDNSAEDKQKIADASKEELEQAVSDRDELLSLVNEISVGLNDIKNLENIISTDGSETPSQKAQIREDITAIQAALIDRRKRLEELEKKLSSSNVYTTKLSKTIEELKQQIDTQNREINTLKQQLNEANAQVDSLNTTVSNVTDERNIAQAEATDLNNQLNTVYIAVGNKKELKDAKILEKKFLSKTKILSGDFNENFFTTKDRRNYTGQILYGAKKAEIKTNMPKDSYTLTKEGNNMVLKITNPTSFWSNTSYLVIQIN